MNELCWHWGELCRKGDVVQWRGDRNSRCECTAVGQTRVMIKDNDDDEYARRAHEHVLLHRAGEAKDRSPEYEYRDENGNAWMPGEWQKISDDGTNATYRRLRQPPAPPAFDPTFAPPGYVAKPAHRRDQCEGCHFMLEGGCHLRPCEARERPDGQDAIFVKADPPAPAKPRRMKGNDKVDDGDAVRNYHSQEHDKDGECDLKPACEPVDPPPAVLGQTKTGYGLKVKGMPEPWWVMYPTWTDAECRRQHDQHYRPDQLELGKMTWTWESMEKTNDPAVARQSP
jgi:hypothetical protein